MSFVREHKPSEFRLPSKIDRDTFFFVADDNYDEHAELAIPFYREMHDELLVFAPQDLSSELRILDLGVGTGKTSEVFLDQYPRASVVGIDLFEEMLEHARLRLAPYGSRVTLKQGDFRSAEFPDNCDICVSALSLHHLNEHEKRALFRRIRATLSPGGTFLMIDWTKFKSQRVQQAAFENAEKHVRAAVLDHTVVDNWCSHWKTENIPDRAEDLVTWMKEAGFSEAECLVRHYGMALFSAEA